MQTEPHDLVERARTGDERAVVQLIELFYQRIYAFLRRLSANETDAEDLTQRTFGRIWQALPTFSGRSTIGSWMHSIAYHTYIDWRRAQRQTEARPDHWWATQVCPGARPDEMAARDDLAARLFALVDQMAPELRESVHLHYYQRLTLQETADALGVATSTVKYRLRQALEELEHKLEARPAPQVCDSNPKTV
jgi:RNA polymerase sigma-70 factor, ECF subfamily